MNEAKKDELGTLLCVEGIMNIEEYREKIKNLDAECTSKKKLLAKQYAFQKNKIQIGDRIKCRHNDIIVKKIQFTTGSHPECVYSGVKLTKKGTPYLNGSKAAIYARDLVL